MSLTDTDSASGTSGIRVQPSNVLSLISGSQPVVHLLPNPMPVPGHRFRRIDLSIVSRGVPSAMYSFVSRLYLLVELHLATDRRQKARKDAPKTRFRPSEATLFNPHSQMSLKKDPYIRVFPRKNPHEASAGAFP